MSTPISDLQKGRLEKIVIENNTYNRYYEVKHSKADKELEAKAQKDIAEIDRLEKEIAVENDKRSNVRSEFSDKQRKVLRMFEKKQEKEFAELDKKLTTPGNVLEAKKLAITQKLEKLGFTYAYGYNNEGRNHAWKPDSGRFNAEYTNWLRDLRAKIITATTAEEAKELVEEFLLK